VIKKETEIILEHKDFTTETTRVERKNKSDSGDQNHSENT
jgi:hypothetical protein